MGKKRRIFSAAQKAKIALEVLKERQTASTLASKFSVHPNQLSQWKQQAQQGVESAFKKQTNHAKELEKRDVLINELYQELGQLQMELKWLKKKHKEL